MRTVTRWITGAVCAAALLAASFAPADAQDQALGDWHGVLGTPAGDLTLIVTISRGDDGALVAVMQSPDQAPGRDIPVSAVTATDAHLSLAIQMIGATYEGDWIAEEEAWAGTFNQGGALPLRLVRGLPEPKPVVEGMDGMWEGTVTRNGVDLRLILRVTTGEQGTIVTFDAPDMGAAGLPVAGFTREGDRVRFTIPASGARYEGSLDEDRMTGTWQLPDRPDATVTFTRTRSDVERVRRERPQEPQPPFPYEAEDVSFANPAAKGVTLAGTLTLPEGEGPFPAAVLISGSGPQDRDETLAGHKPFAVLADYLTRAGIAVLRYDDRGFGASTGDHGAATSADFATDANAAVRYLLTRPDIDVDAIGFIGHSEGGIIGPIAATANPEIDYLVLLASPGTSTLQLMRAQRYQLGLARGESADDMTRADRVITPMAEAMVGARDQEEAMQRVGPLLTADALSALQVPAGQADIFLRRFTTDWNRYFLQYRPAAFLSRIDVPVLALGGSLDVLVPADENLPAIERALGHNPDVTIVEIEGLNHMFQTAETGGIGEYADLEETFAPGAMAIVADWVNARF